MSPSTTEREAFFRNILASPDEDTLRLAFADYLSDLDPVRVVCPKCAGCKSVTTRWRQAEMDKDEYGYSTGPCMMCVDTEGKPTGTVLDTSDADLAELIRTSIEYGNPNDPDKVQSLSTERPRRLSGRWATPWLP